MDSSWPLCPPSEKVISDGLLEGCTGGEEDNVGISLSIIAGAKVGNGLGSTVGAFVGNVVGHTERMTLGGDDGSGEDWNDEEGSIDGASGTLVGSILGWLEGCIDGDMVGLSLSILVGIEERDGAREGKVDVFSVLGLELGARLVVSEGKLEDCADGREDRVGAWVGNFETEGNSL